MFHLPPSSCPLRLNDLYAAQKSKDDAISSIWHLPQVAMGGSLDNF